MSNRANILRRAIAAVDAGELMQASAILRESAMPIDQENATNCMNLSIGGSPQMIQTLGYVLRKHLEMTSAPAPSHRASSTSVAAGTIPKWSDKPIPRSKALPASNAPSGARKLGCGLTSLVLLAPTLAFIVLANTTEWGTSPTMGVIWLTSSVLAIVFLVVMSKSRLFSTGRKVLHKVDTRNIEDR
jgi:hypothetical protein